MCVQVFILWTTILYNCFDLQYQYIKHKEMSVEFSILICREVFTMCCCSCSLAVSGRPPVGLAADS